MKLYRFLVVLVQLQVNAAVFTVFNKGTEPITVEKTWQSDDVATVIQPGSSVTFNSLFADVYRILWHTKTKNSARRSFEVVVNLGFLNLGGIFEISDEGHYNYYFGVDGSGKGIGKTS